MFRGQARGKADGNQKEILEGIRKLNETSLLTGFQWNVISIANTQTQGGGFPDLVLGYRGTNYLVEIKNPSRKGAKLNVKQVEFHRDWRGSTLVVHDLDELLDGIGYQSPWEWS